MGGSLSSLSNDIGLRLGTLPGLFVLVVNSDVGWIVGVSSILSNGGGINLDIGNNDGYDEGFCCKRGTEFNRSRHRELVRKSGIIAHQTQLANLTYWHTADVGD